MIGTIVITIIAGGLVAGVLVWVIRQRKVNAPVRTLDDADRHVVNLSTDLTKHAARVETGVREVAAPETMVGQMRDATADQPEIIEQLRTELQSATAAKEHWVSRAGQAAEETVRPRGLALTFERWHEQMIPLMEQNHNMHAENEELQSIARHVVIVSLNASIKAVCAGTVGRGSVMMASKVYVLATHSEELSESYHNNLYSNDLTTIVTFQNIQAGGKVIITSLSNVRALASQFQHQLHQVGLT